MLFPQLPRKTHNFGKNRAFLGKNKWATRSVGKNKKKRIILTKKQENTLIFLQAFSHTFPEKLLFLGKIGGFLGKSGALLGKIPCFWENGNLVKNLVHAPHALKGQKLLAQGTRPG